MEEVQEEIQTVMSELSVDNLSEIAEELGISPDEVSEMMPRSRVRSHGCRRAGQDGGRLAVEGAEDADAKGASPGDTEYRSASMLLPHRRWGSGRKSLAHRNFPDRGTQRIGTKSGDVLRRRRHHVAPIRRSSSPSWLPPGWLARHPR